MGQNDHSYINTQSNPHQAGIDRKPIKSLFSKLETGTRHGSGDGELEVMGLQYFILPFIILGVGILLSIAVWFMELII